MRYHASRTAGPLHSTFMKTRHSSLDCCFVEFLEGRKLLSSVADGVVPALDFSRYQDFEIQCPPPGSLVKRPCLIQAGMIQGRLFDDSNGNGVRDSGEAAVQGAAVLLTRQSGDVVEVLRKEITDALGGFIFGLLRPGQYTVTVRSSRLREIESRSIEVTIDGVETQAIDVGVK